MAQHIVTAPLVVVTNHDGSQLYLYGGAPVPPSLPEGELQRHIDSGMIAEVDQPEPSGAGGDAGDQAETEDEHEDEGEGGDDRPAGNASRDAWAEYAQAHGHDVTDEMTRDDLRALFD